MRDMQSMIILTTKTTMLYTQKNISPNRMGCCYSGMDTERKVSIDEEISDDEDAQEIRNIQMKFFRVLEDSIDDIANKAGLSDSKGLARSYNPELERGKEILRDLYSRLESVQQALSIHISHKTACMPFSMDIPVLRIGVDEERRKWVETLWEN